MDPHVRIWDGGEVKTRYVGSEFLGHATAQDIVERMQNVLSETGMKNLVQLSMDGPNVNWKVFNLLQSDLLVQINRSLLNIGSCGLHTLHNAFRDGYKASGWDVEHTLSSMYWLFKNSPARKEDFIKLTGCDIPMLKFCQHRWVENVKVCERGLMLWPHVMQYVNAVSQGELPDPKIKSFQEIKKACADPLFPVKTAVFQSIAKQITPFLVQYQTDKPMLPFMGEDMYQLLKGNKHVFASSISSTDNYTIGD